MLINFSIFSLEMKLLGTLNVPYISNSLSLDSVNEKLTLKSYFQKS